jgi:hypothetical protein
VLARGLSPSLGAPRLQQLVLACQQPFHGRVPIDALDAVLRNDQLVTGTVSAQARFAGFPLRTTHEDVQHRAIVYGKFPGPGSGSEFAARCSLLAAGECFTRAVLRPVRCVLPDVPATMLRTRQRS